MEPTPQEIDRERARLLEIIGKERPARKPGARTRAWEVDRRRAIVALNVHLLVGLKSTHCLADFVRDLKKAATNRVHENLHEEKFAWQNGYAAFSVSATSREAVRGYIAKQEEHHRTKTFREEWIALLDRAGIEYDTRLFGLSGRFRDPCRGRIDFRSVSRGVRPAASTPG